MCTPSGEDHFRPSGGAAARPAAPPAPAVPSRVSRAPARIARVSLLTPLNPDQRTTFLVVTMPAKSLRKLVGQLGTAEKGVRLETLSPWDLAWSLIDYYDNDAEVARLVDKALRKEVGDPPLAGAVAAEGGAQAVRELLLASRDPARDFAWALLRWGGEGAGEIAAEMVQTIIQEFDDADERAKAEAEKDADAPAENLDPAQEAERLAREAEKDAARAMRARARALKRVGTMKERLVELEEGMAAARRDLRVSEEARARVASERDRLIDEREHLRAQLKTGDAATVTRLTEELETAKRRVRSLESESDELREAETTLRVRVRALEEGARVAAPTGDGEDAPGAGATWNLPIFTDEFYESIRRWDRKIVRNAVEKVYRLAEDWRHPSLRAIPLEGLPGCYRIRVATDVRLIYRPIDGNRVEVMSLIDREDLQRYIRQAKSR